MACKITQESLNEIKTALGYPVACVLDWGSSANDDDYITNFVINRVLRIYSTFFPTMDTTQHSINREFTIPYPDNDEIFKAYQWFFNSKSIYQGAMTNPFVLQSQILATGSLDGDRQASPWNVNEMINREATYESVMNYQKVERIDDLQDQRILKGFSSQPSQLMVRWAKKVSDFTAITFQYVDDAIKLAKSYLMQDAYRQRESIKVSSNKVDINSESFINMALTWEQEVTQAWKGRGVVTISAG